MPQVHLICNAHLDPYWLWEWEEGAAAAISTFRTAADLCEEFEGFVFNHNEVILYRWVERYEPELFSQIQRLVREKRWHIMGGWWLQPDCNLPSGESFVRQILLGYTWFKEKFGVYPKTAINFDPFGHNRGLVQILHKAGFDSYIVCRPGQVDCPLPQDDFIWVGFDGSEILVHRDCYGYNSPLGQATDKINQLREVYKDRPVSVVLWGVGNHGGGPSREDLRSIAGLISENKNEKIFHSTPENYFNELKSSGMVLPRVESDLNPWAVGCYTSQVRIKQKHRRLENELFMVEKMVSSASMAGLMVYPKEELLEASRDLATAQFHDILPGSSIQPVEEAGIRLLDHGLEILSREKAHAFFALSSGQPVAAEGEIPILIYNPHPYAVRGLFECEFQMADQNWKDEFTWVEAWQNGKPVPTQVEKELSSLNLDWRKRVVFSADLEPSQMNRLDCKLRILPSRPQPTLKASDGLIRFRNDSMEVSINTVTGLLDVYRVDGIDFLKPGSLQGIVMEDNEDPWGMLVQSFRNEIGRFRLLSSEEGTRFSGVHQGRLESVRVIEEGEVRVVVESVFGFGDSFLVQTIKLPRQGSRVEVQIRVHWNEKDRLLKWSLPTCLSGSRYLGQVAYGVQSFPMTGREVAAQQWVALVDDTSGHALAVINDGVYGSDCSEGEIRMSLVRSPAYSGHPILDRPILPQDRYMPRIDQGERLYTFWLEGGPAARILESVGRDALNLNQPPMVLSFFPSGAGSPVPPLVRLEGGTVEMNAFKQSEDGKGWILRMSESTGKPQTTVVSIRGVDPVEFSFAPYEIKTVYIEQKSNMMKQVDLLERPILSSLREEHLGSPEG